MAIVLLENHEVSSLYIYIIIIILDQYSLSNPTHLYCWRVDVLLGVDHGEEHLHKAFGLIL